MDNISLYENLIERTIDSVMKAPESSNTRREVIDAIKRKWLASLTINASDSSNGTNDDSDPTSVDRSKYVLNPIEEPDNEMQPTSKVSVESDDEFADEFGETEFVHATQVGKKLAETSRARAEDATPDSGPLQRAPLKKEIEILNPEELDDSLADSEYDDIPEPINCPVRVFGQTEVCESILGPKRADSRWMVTVLNGFVRVTATGEEIPFRTANQTMPHLHQH